MATKQDLMKAVSDLRLKRVREQQERRTRSRVMQAEIEMMNALIMGWVNGVDHGISAKLSAVDFDGEEIVDLSGVQGLEFEIMGRKAFLRPALENGALVFKSENLGEPFMIFREQQEHYAQDEYVRAVFDESFMYGRIVMALPAE